MNRGFRLKSRNFRRVSAQFWHVTRAQSLQKHSLKRKGAWPGVQSIWNESARFSCVLRALSAPKMRNFAIEIRAILHAKILKISAIAASDAITRRRNDTDDHFTHDEQDALVFLRSTMLFVAKFCIHEPWFSIEIAKFSTSFGAILARDTRAEPAKAFPEAQECMARRPEQLE